MVMSWWNFGWVSALDATGLFIENCGASDSILVLTFRDALSGAQIDLEQINVPDYKVRIPNPD